MRVTKTVKDYIYKEVTARMEKRYEAEAAEAKRQQEAFESIEENALAAATAAYKNVLREAVKDNPFLAIEDEESAGQLSHPYRSGPRLAIVDKNVISSVHCWRTRMRNEVEEKVNEIVVSLELGGTREELMKMLAEI